MNRITFLGITAGAVIATALAALLVANGISPAAPAAFSQGCNESLHQAARWAVQEAERTGKSVSTARQTSAVAMIPTVCSCLHDALRDDIDGSDWAVAGHLAGTQYKISLALRARDAEVRASARAASRDELQKLTAEHNIALRKVGIMSRKVDVALRRCMRAHRPSS